MNRQAINSHLSEYKYGQYKAFVLKVNVSKARYETCGIVWNIVRKVDPVKAGALKAEAVAIRERAG